MPGWLANALADPVLRWAVYATAALAAVTVGTMLQVLVLAELNNRRLARRRAFDADWRPRLAEATLFDRAPPPWPAPRAQERLWFLLLWGRTQRQLRGPSHARLNRLLLDYGLDGYALELLRRRGIHLRLLALAVLRELADAAHWGVVARFLRHDNPFLALAAAEVLVTIDAPRAMREVLPVVVARRDWTPQRVAALLQLAGRAAVSPPLLDALHAAPAAECRRIAPLTQWADPAVLAGWARGVLDRLPESPEPAVRQAALQVVGSLRDDSDRARLAQAIADADPGVRLAALKALGKQAALNDLDSLLALLHDPDWAVRQEAADAIAAQPGFDRAAVERIAETVTDRYGRDALRRAIAERHP
jgi:hypothetical protein